MGSQVGFSVQVEIKLLASGDATEFHRAAVASERET